MLSFAKTVYPGGYTITRSVDAIRPASRSAPRPLQLAPEVADLVAQGSSDQSDTSLANVSGFGLVDTFRKHHADAGKYSWWDYRNLAFPKNLGLRIDHVLATRPLADKCVAAWIDRDTRKGKLPSDHAPVGAEFDL